MLSLTRPALPGPCAAAPQQLWSLTAGFVFFLSHPLLSPGFLSSTSSCFSQQYCRFYLRQQPTLSKDKMILVILLSPAFI